ncbi:MAG: carboxypeptidase-like regulatory domain-containing protein [Acidobacteriaceae bacterium]
MRRLLPLLFRPLAVAWLALLLSGAAALAAQAQDLSDASGFTVAGTVLSAASGQPIARAEVILGNEQAQLTTNDGTFSFDHVPAGNTTLSIRKPGYMGFGALSGDVIHTFGSGSASRESGPPRRILVGPEMPTLTFRLTPLAAVSGHLTLSTADPADQIRISLFRREFQDGRARWSVAAVTQTRSNGSWRAANLDPGRYMVLTSAAIDGPSDPERSEAPIWGFPALYYPGVTDVGSAGVLILKAGQQAQADMTLVRQRFFPVTIAIHGMPDTPTSLEIADTGGRPTGLPVHLDARSQIAHANVPNGSWTLIARAFGATLRFGRTDFQVAGAPVSLTVSVAPVPPIPVIINREFTPSADGSLPSSRWGWVNLALLPADDSVVGGVSSMHPAEGSDGTRYEIGIFQPGSFWVRTANPDSTYVASVTSGGADLATTPLTVMPGSPSPPIEVTLRNDAGTIAGTIDNRSPGAAGGAGEQPQVWIYAIPLFPTTGHLPETSLRDNGQFALANLAPGSYRVVACDAPQEIDFHSTEGLAAWSGKGQVVTVDPNGAANVELPVIHGDGSQ